MMLSLVFFAYLMLPSPQFPQPLSDSPQSEEPGDVIDLANKRAYFTDQNRPDITQHYQLQFRILSLPFFTPIRLNYPPEEAAWHIFPNPKSSYLEEYVFPLRESIFVNGYQPGPKEDKIAFEGRPYVTKVTVRYKQSSVFTRLLIGSTVVLSTFVLLILWKSWFSRLINIIKS